MFICSVNLILTVAEISKLFLFVFNLADPSLAFMQSLQQQLGAETQLQSLPPAVQKAIFLHLTQQQQQQESHPQGNEPQRAEGQDDNSNRGKSQKQEAPFIKLR